MSEWDELAVDSGVEDTEDTSDMEELSAAEFIEDDDDGAWDTDESDDDEDDGADSDDEIEADEPGVDPDNADVPEEPEVVAVSATARAARGSVSYNGLTSAQYNTMRKAGATPSALATTVGIEVARRMLSEGSDLKDEALGPELVFALEVGTEEQNLTAVWWNHVSETAKKRVFNAVRKAVTA